MCSDAGQYVLGQYCYINTDSSGHLALIALGRVLTNFRVLLESINAVGRPHRKLL